MQKILIALVLASVPALAQAVEKEKLLWDSWYTVTVGEGIHYGVYNDQARVKDGKLYFRNDYQKKEEGFINEEQLGTVSEAESLKPLFFNFRSRYRATELLIDGSVQDGKMTVKIRKGKEELPVVKRTVPSKAIFEQAFPAWIAPRLKNKKPGDSIPFLSIVESDPDQGFGAENGRAKLEKPDAIAEKTKTRKLAVEYRDRKSFWWIDDKGQLERLEIPAQQTVIERVPKAKADGFLKE